MIWEILRFELQAFRPRLPRQKFHIIVHENVYHQSLDFICRKEPPRARMAAEPERHISRIARYVLCFACLAGVSISKPCKAKCVIFLWVVGNEFWVHGDGLSWDADGCI